eukprot:510287_1
MKRSKTLDLPPSKKAKVVTLKERKISITDSCIIYNEIKPSSVPVKQRSHSKHSKSTHVKTSHSFSPRRIVKHEILKQLLKLFLLNKSNTKNILVIHPYTGNFRNYNDSQICDGSSKIIIDTILNLSNKLILSNIFINIVFIDIYQNQLFDDITNYLQNNIKHIGTLKLNIYVFNSSVEEFFGLQNVINNGNG